MRVAAAVVVAAASILVFGNFAPAKAAVGPCTDVQIIGLRGSGEPFRAEENGMGSLLGPIATAIAAQAQDGATVSFYGVPYKAGDASWKTVLSQSYFDSKKEGMRMLHAYLQEVVAACPDMKLVVMGYSQGAHAAGDQVATEATAITDRIAALVLFADPRFNPSASYAWGTYDPRNYGLAGARSLTDFASYSNRVMSFCRQNDLVCQGVGVKHSTAEHAQALYLGAYESFAAGLVRRKLGWPRPANSKTPLDLAFVIDSTGSMGSSISSVTSAAANIAKTLEDRGADFRVGLVDYKDVNQGDPYAARVVLPMTTDVGAFSNAVQSLRASGGGDYPEAVHSGIMTAINGLAWRSVPRKGIILMGDAPAKNPEPVTGYTRTGVLDAARNLDPAIIYPLAVGSGPLTDFQALAEGSGGTVFTATSSAQVATQILSAVDAAAVPIVAGLTVGSPARTGTEVQFSAAASYYDNGEIIGYDWDFDGDGVIDQSSVENRVTHVYSSPFDGIVKLTIRADDGESASTTAALVVSDSTPEPPSAPTNLTGEAAAGSSDLVISWEPPANDGGAIIVGYSLRVESNDTSEVVGAAITDGATTSVRLSGLEPGSYALAVSATNLAGPGDEATTTVQLGSAFDFGGFGPPIVDPPDRLVRQAGSSLPVRFSLGGDHGLDVLAEGSPSYVRIDCDSGVETGTTQLAASARRTDLTYDETSDEYLFVWKTDRSLAGACLQFSLQLTDGSSHQFQVGMRAR